MKKVEGIKKNKKKQSVLEDSENNDMEISRKIMDLCILYQIEDSHNAIKLFSNEIKMYEAQKRILLNSRSCIFKKKKIGKELEEIDNKIYKLYEDISEEFSIISKMEEAITKDEINKHKNSNKLVSYYDLLSLLKTGIIYKKIILHKFDTKEVYIYDGCNYVIENEKNINDRFERYLSDADADIAKFDKNIELIKNDD